MASRWPKRRFCSASPKSSGSFSRVVCCTTRGPVNAISAPGSAIVTSPSDANDASTPAVVGCAITVSIGKRASCSSSTAQTVFGSCISERIPSCMRAPPELVTETSGTPRSTARVARARELLADGAAHRAAHEREVHHGELERMPVDRGLPDDHRFAQPGVELRFGETLRVRPQVEELERVVGADVGRLLDERALVGVPRDPPAGRHREVMPAVAADPECGLELVVAEVRAALGARVRVLRVRRGRSVLVLDLDVDPGLGHW